MVVLNYSLSIKIVMPNDVMLLVLVILAFFEKGKESNKTNKQTTVDKRLNFVVLIIFKTALKYFYRFLMKEACIPRPSFHSCLS